LPAKTVSNDVENRLSSKSAQDNFTVGKNQDGFHPGAHLNALDITVVKINRCRCFRIQSDRATIIWNTLEGFIIPFD
jgi:hypothetical protein